jgi:hypothetical protein
MTETNTTPLLEKRCVVWSTRRQREITLRVYFDVEEQDGCKIYTLQQQIERQ